MKIKLICSRIFPDIYFMSTVGAGKMQTQKQTKDYSNKIITIPNLMSLFRLFLIPVCVWLYFEKEDYRWTAFVLLFSWITDVADGYIARRFNMISNFGKMFDPIADKLTQLIMLICLISRFPLMWAPMILLVIKEAIDTVTGLWVIHKLGEVLGAEWHGKIATFFLYVTIGLHLIWYEIPMFVSNGLILACVVMMLISLVKYNLYRYRLLKEQSINMVH